jgi:hypothetical protein
MQRRAHPARRSAVLAAMAATAILVSACGAGAATPSGSGGGGGGGGIGHPTGAQPVFAITYAGGMIANGHLTTLPGFWMTGDGLVVMPGAMIDIFPGPLMPPLNARRLTEEGVQTVLGAIAASKQFSANAEWRGAQNFVADAGDTILTLHAEDREVKITVFALGWFTPDQVPPNVAPAEVAAHVALNTLVNRLTTLDQWLPASAWAESGWQPYKPAALRLLVRNADADPPDDTGIGETLIDWPTDDNPATFGEETVLGERCGVVTGEAAQKWLTSLEPANQLSRWLKGEHRYAVTPRPLLPGEAENCPAG